ncbi:acyltransferase domain-containing protein, partial [Nocardiopsis valliformis]|uniref:acyltransferase domain-containing protein n=1 Tax=Nocardiopsis valliformis TaxID=239974 RepID=UPI001268C55A
MLSARSPQGLRDQATRLTNHIQNHPDTNIHDIGLTLATHRTTLDHRAAVWGNDHHQLLTALNALTHNQPAPNTTTATRTRNRKTAFLFTGQGSQRLGMGRQLYNTHPTFAHTLDTICTHLDPHLEHPLKTILFAPHDSPHAHLIHQTLYTQCALFAIETALFNLLHTWGIKPDYLLGHSIGEITAAHAAGTLDLPNAATLVATRGHLMQTARTGGAMAAIEATEEQITTSLNGTDTVTIAGLNSPTSTVISGDADDVHKIADHWRTQGHRVKNLTVSHAFHSPHMDTVLPKFRETVSTLEFHTGHTPVISNLTGTPATPEQHSSPDYWAQHLRGTVRFTDGLHYLHTQGVTDYIELGPDPVLTSLVTATLPDEPLTLTPLLRNNHPETQTLTHALATQHTRGTTINWHQVFPHAHRVDLPHYAFQHTRYWL